jgi:uridine phosphorylase
LDSAQKLARNREYHTYTGVHRGVAIAVTSHGVGASGAAICFEELIRAGASTLIRMGTCGTFVEDLEPGDLLVASAVAREDGYTQRTVPIGFPAVADLHITLALCKAAKRAGARYRAGIVVATDVFYPGVLDTRLATHAAAGALGVEMECGALFILGSLRGVRTGGVLTVDGHPLRRTDDMAEYHPRANAVQTGVDCMISVALDAITEAVDHDAA